MPKSLLCISIIALCLSACSLPTKVVQKYPAQQELPYLSERILIVDASQAAPGKGRQLVNTIEDIVSGEGPTTDQEGVKAVVEGIKSYLQDSSERSAIQETVYLHSYSYLGEPGTLDSLTIDSLGRRHQAEAVLIIQAYDVNIPLLTSNRYTKRNNVEVQFAAYDPNGHHFIGRKKLVNKDYQKMTSSLNKEKTALLMSYQLGRDYMRSLEIHYKTTQWSLHHSGSAQIKLGCRRANEGNWEGAFATWQSQSKVERKKRKIAYLYANMAVAKIILEDCQQALQLINQAIQLENKNSFNVLKQQIEKRAKEIELISIQERKQ